eukprot:9435406-Pyramimonas_sp.AAC.1
MFLVRQNPKACWRESGVIVSQRVQSEALARQPAVTNAAWKERDRKRRQSYIRGRFQCAAVSAESSERAETL